MPSPSCIVEAGKLSPVGQRNLYLFQSQSGQRLLVVLMSKAHVDAGYVAPEPSGAMRTAWMLPCRQMGMTIGTSLAGLRSDSKAIVVLNAEQWAATRNQGRYKGQVFQVWGDGGDARSWPVMPPDEPPAQPQ